MVYHVFNVNINIPRGIKKSWLNDVICHLAGPLRSLPPGTTTNLFSPKVLTGTKFVFTKHTEVIDVLSFFSFFFLFYT